MKILELKNAVNEVNPLNGLASRSYTVKERISGYEDRSTKMIKIEAERKDGRKNPEYVIHEMI